MVVDDIIEVSQKYNHKIAKSCEPLFYQFGINGFLFQEVSNDGFWSSIRSNLDWDEYILENDLYHYNPTLVDPKFYQSGTFYTASHNDPEFNIMRGLAKEVFNLDHALVIIIKTDFGCEFIQLSTTPENMKIINCYINHLPQLIKFINYFKLENQSILQDARKYRVDLKNLRGDAYFNSKNRYEVIPNKLINDDKQSMLANLSLREKQCLKYFIDGKTTKETAKILNLSPRTIEDYTVKLKDKFNCEHKRELIAVLKKVIP